MKRFALIAAIITICLSGNLFAIHQKDISENVNGTYVEVLYFHGKQRCPTCIAIGDNAKDVVYKNFASQVKSGQVRFREIDISTTAGEKIADRYHVTWSSLYVNQWKDGKEKRTDMTSFGFDNARTDVKTFRNGLKNKIIQLLK